MDSLLRRLLPNRPSTPSPSSEQSSILSRSPSTPPSPILPEAPLPSPQLSSILSLDSSPIPSPTLPASPPRDMPEIRPRRASSAPSLSNPREIFPPTPPTPTSSSRSSQVFFEDDSNIDFITPNDEGSQLGQIMAQIEMLRRHTEETETDAEEIRNGISRNNNKILDIQQNLGLFQEGTATRLHELRERSKVKESLLRTWKNDAIVEIGQLRATHDKMDYAMEKLEHQQGNLLERVQKLEEAKRMSFSQREIRLQDRENRLSEMKGAKRRPILQKIKEIARSLLHRRKAEELCDEADCSSPSIKRP